MSRRAAVGSQVFDLEVDNQGVLRFRKNRIIRDLLDTASGPRDMNAVVMKVYAREYTLEEYRELLALIGYSVSGFGELSLNQNIDVTEISGDPDEVETLASQLSEADGHLEVMRSGISEIREILDRMENGEDE